MKLVLASQGFTTEEIAKSVECLVGKSLADVDICIVDECTKRLHFDKNKRWYIEELANIAKYIGGKIRFADFELHSREEIEQNFVAADIIYFVGGERHVLAEKLRRIGVVDLLRKCANEKVLMGTSAGAMCLCRQIDSKKFWSERYGMDIAENRENLELGLAPFAIIPHYMREDHAQWTKEFLADVLGENSFSVYAIRDDQAAIYNDGEIEFVGGNPDIFGKTEEK